VAPSRCATAAASAFSQPPPSERPLRRVRCPRSAISTTQRPRALGTGKASRTHAARADAAVNLGKSGAGAHCWTSQQCHPPHHFVNTSIVSPDSEASASASAGCCAITSGRRPDAPAGADGDREGLMVSRAGRILGPRAGHPLDSPFRRAGRQCEALLVCRNLLQRDGLRCDRVFEHGGGRRNRSRAPAAANHAPSCGGLGRRKFRRLRCYHANADFARLRLVSNPRLRWATNP